MGLGACSVGPDFTRPDAALALVALYRALVSGWQALDGEEAAPGA
ncbi:hypothetical protein PHLH8_14360 [Pseudomonas sp. Pc102]|nr:hypothetical protein PHLH8_14360 [Pseudomonas sp. Pc102]